LEIYDSQRDVAQGCALFVVSLNGNVLVAAPVKAAAWSER